jgi:hypothetical protein
MICEFMLPDERAGWNFSEVDGLVNQFKNLAPAIMWHGHRMPFVVKQKA